MHEFFHSWRRKAGCVTLVMALFLFGQWMRSLGAEHRLLLSRTEAFLSSGGCLTMVALDRGGHIDTWFPAQHDVIVYHSGRGWSKLWLSSVLGARFGLDTYGDAKMELAQAWWCRIPYWEIILPLTLLSVYLLLWKPRKVGAGQKCEPSVPETTQPPLTDFREK